jgi:hypothetical protein
MRRTIPVLAALVVALGLITPAVGHAGKPENAGKPQDAGKPEEAGKSGKSTASTTVTSTANTAITTTAGVKFGSADIQAFRDYMAKNPGYAGSVKPMPPGMEKKIQKGQPLPPGIQKTRLPEGLSTRLPKREGCEVALLGRDAVLIGKDGKVLDVLPGAVAPPTK